MTVVHNGIDLPRAGRYLSSDNDDYWPGKNLYALSQINKISMKFFNESSLAVCLDAVSIDQRSDPTIKRNRGFNIFENPQC